MKDGLLTSRAERLSYGGFFLGQNLIYLIQFQFLAYFYTEEMGLSPEAATLLLLIARLWDACNDPLIGALIDRVHLKSGRFLPWLRFVTYAVPLSIVFVFFNMPAGDTGKLAYAYVSYILWGMLYTVSDPPLFALSTAMTDRPFERDKLLTSGRFAAALAAIMSAVFMNLKAALGWTGTVAAYALLAFAMMMPLQFLCKERITYERKPMSFLQIFRTLFSNKYLLIYYIGYLALQATNVLQIIVAYFANANLGDEKMVVVLMGVTVVPVLVVAPLLPRLIQRFGKRRLTMICSVAVVALCIVQYFAGYQSLALMLAICAVRVVAIQIPLLIYGMFTTDCIEYGAYTQGKRTEGAAFAIQTFVTKLGGALAAALCLQVMALYGYVPQAAQQTPEALGGIWLILSLAPGIGYVVMWIIMKFFYKLDEAEVQRIMQANKANIVAPQPADG